MVQKDQHFILLLAMAAIWGEKKHCRCLSLVTKVLYTKFGAEWPTFDFSLGRFLAMATILTAMGREGVMKTKSFIRYSVSNLVTKDLTV